MQYMNRIGIYKLLDDMYATNVVIGMKKVVKKSLHIFGQRSSVNLMGLSSTVLDCPRLSPIEYNTKIYGDSHQD